MLAHHHVLPMFVWTSLVIMKEFKCLSSAGFATGIQLPKIKKKKKSLASALEVFGVGWAIPRWLYPSDAEMYVSLLKVELGWRQGGLP